ncbi:MAG: cryptochrome/photolyase family protein [Rubrivivax sp.]|jgi:deoxyribodipyrimidine photolyase-related protein|nr:cryptochrome/photolyase family protein [Rubrivivax sp.]
MRDFVLVLGDQLNRDSAAFDGHDATRDGVWMAEVAEESTVVWSSQPRTALFLSAMRHHAQALRDEGLALDYTRLEDGVSTLADALAAALRRHRPERLVLAAPGDWRVLQALRAVAAAHDVPLDLRDDRHFYDTVRGFAEHARVRRQLRLETYYREMRVRHGVLMDDGAPAGGRWNFDADNRQGFPREGPPPVPLPARYEPDAITREVIALVRQRYAGHPGSLDDFAWPVTPAQARDALDRFVAERLPDFGHWQDAMWPGQPWLWHAHLSAALNLKLLDPRDAVQAAEAAYRAGRAPLAAVEGFIRQILGWREYVRGIYWTQMPGYTSRNELGATAALPAWYWTGETDMACLHDAIGQTLRLGYAHHIQRLMVTGLFPLLLGVDPDAVHRWYGAVYVDAVDWVERPNTLGMSQHADGGLMGSKPYIASGQYIDRMSGYCRGCRYRPDRRTGDDACPYTTLYWDFLMRHEARYKAHPRLAQQVRNLGRIAPAEREAIAAQAQRIRIACASDGAQA